MISRVSDYIKNITGLYFPPEKYNDLERAINNAKDDFGFEDKDEFINWLLKNEINDKQIKKLALHLTVGETYFFRDIRSMEIIRDKIIPNVIDDLRNGRKTFKIWCAGCSTGEEPYSIAIWLNEFIANFKNLDIKILASDINLKSLEKAKSAVYSEWSFRGTPVWVKNKYFKKNDKNFILDNQIKKLVDFSYINLAENNYPSIINNIHSIDIILCRNVLMYFDSEVYRNVVAKFYKSLNNQGWFFVSSVEVSREKNLEELFIPIHFRGLTVYKKRMGSDYLYNQEHFINSISDEKLLFIQPEDILEDNKEDILNNYEKALEFYKLKDYQSAQNTLLEILKNDKNNTSIIKLLANINADQGDYEKAFEYCFLGLEIDKIEPEFHYIMSNIYSEKKDIENSISQLKKVLYLAENHLLANYNLASIFTNKKDYKNALKLLFVCKDILDTYNDNENIPFSDQANVKQMKSIINSQIERLKNNE